ncbi:DUF4442 domain-containing protein [Paracrocinitomix mangrovi]|uniref:DUF4442 domain-containing protein n=1 Tax=Paracrocinitomix mangrovi TaxID=2862509 RepID=UPI001C8EF809|nr:DUF4442 domain-containing protein [Paracrocinitomix mangrovi]UKN01705.1 DUF4442 domain-containing protein [Paracrocinitomix mangrovi]
MDFKKYIDGAKKSAGGLRKLNFGLGLMIPFNKPHRIKVKSLEDDKIVTTIPYRRKNLNHIKGIHACALATTAEFASGLLLLTKLEAKKYRLIMESIEMKYHYQAKMNVTAEFECTDQWIEENVKGPLSQEDQVFVKCEINLYDSNRNHIATGYTNWQIKDWEKVKTKL